MYLISIALSKIKLLFATSYHELPKLPKEFKLVVDMYLNDAIAFVGAPWKSLSRTEEEKAIWFIQTENCWNSERCCKETNKISIWVSFWKKGNIWWLHAENYLLSREVKRIDKIIQTTLGLVLCKSLSTGVPLEHWNPHPVLDHDLLDFEMLFQGVH